MIFSDIDFLGLLLFLCIGGSGTLCVQFLLLAGCNKSETRSGGRSESQSGRQLACYSEGRVAQRVARSERRTFFFFLGGRALHFFPRLCGLSEVRGNL